MVARVLLLFWVVTAARAQQDEYLVIDRPLDGNNVQPDAFTVEWYYDYDYDRLFTIELFPTDATLWDDSIFYTTVSAEDSTTTLPASLLPSLQPGQTSMLFMTIYTTDDSGLLSGTQVYDILLFAPAQITSTVTMTVKPSDTAGPTPTPSAVPEEEETDETGDDGLSARAKTGTGLGASAGALLLAAGAFILFRRLRKDKPPKMIREISVTGPPSAVFGGAGSENKSKPVGLSVAALPLSASAVSSEERYELGG